MIRNPGTCGAYSIRPYADRPKDLFLRSIFDHEKQNDYFFDPKNGYAESIILLLESKNGHAKWHDPFFDPKNGYAKQQERFSEKCFWGMFLRYLFRGIFFFVAK